MHRRLVIAALVTLLAGASLGAQRNDATYVVTYVDVKPASTRQGAGLINQYVRDTAADQGAMSVEGFQEIGRTNRFVVVAVWRDAAAFAVHEKALHTTAFRESLKAIHRSPYDQRVNRAFEIDATPGSAGGNAVYVVTHVDVPGAQREAAEKLLQVLVPPSRRDPGHVRYDVYQQTDRTNHFTVVAAWSTRDAFEASGNTPHALQFREALGPMLGALYDERLYQRLPR